MAGPGDRSQWQWLAAPRYDIRHHAGHGERQRETGHRQGQLHRQDSDHHHGPRRPEQDRGCPRHLCSNCVRDSWSARPRSTSTCRGAAQGRSRWRSAVRGRPPGLLTVVPVSPTTSCSWLTLSAMSGTTPSHRERLRERRDSRGGLQTVHDHLLGGESQRAEFSPNVTVNLTVPDPGFVATPTDITIWQKIGAIRRPSRARCRSIRPSAADRLDCQRRWRGLRRSTLRRSSPTARPAITDDGLVIDGVLAPTPDWLEFTPAVGYHTLDDDGLGEAGHGGRHVSRQDHHRRRWRLPTQEVIRDCRRRRQYLH